MLGVSCKYTFIAKKICKSFFLIKGQNGYLQYQDTSTGKSVSRLRIPHGRCDCLTSNPYNAVVQLGHANGLFTSLFLYFLLLTVGSRVPIIANISIMNTVMINIFHVFLPYLILFLNYLSP